jgi:hypothetical protein
MHRHFPSLTAPALVACVPVLGLVMAAGPGTAPAARTPANPGAAAARALLDHLKTGQHAVGHQAGPVIRVKGVATKVTSGNWAGYADSATSSRYSKVTGSWTEPKATCTSLDSLAAFSVGIDGYASTSMEQDGSLIECVGGKAFYYTWWEMYPKKTMQMVGSSVKPGDKIAASVVRTGTSYTLTVTDSTTTANSFSTTQTCAATSCVDSSAEWVAEAPLMTFGTMPLSKFSTWTLKGATVTAGTSGTISSFPDAEITMVIETVTAEPSALNSAGNQFKVFWKAST